MSEKNIFIGLGGSGIRTVARICQNLHNNEDAAYKNYGFVFIDADEDEDEVSCTNNRMEGIIQYSDVIVERRPRGVHNLVRGLGGFCFW